MAQTKLTGWLNLLVCVVILRTPKASLFVALITGVLWSGCSRHSLTVEFVFPDGFTGVAKLRSGQTPGIAPVTTNETITLVFPTSGVLDIKGNLPTLDWHMPIARYRNGNAIPVLTPPNQISDDTVALRHLGLKN